MVPKCKGGPPPLTAQSDWQSALSSAPGHRQGHPFFQGACATASGCRSGAQQEKHVYQHKQLTCVASPLSLPSPFFVEINPLCVHLPPNTQMALLRTWSNRWFTTHQTHAENSGGSRLPCILGCEGESDSSSIILGVTLIEPCCPSSRLVILRC